MSETFSAQQIAEAWQRVKQFEEDCEKQLAARKAALAHMIDHRSDSLREVSQQMGVSHAYPGQIVKKFGDPAAQLHARVHSG